MSEATTSNRQVQAKQWNWFPWLMAALLLPPIALPIAFALNSFKGERGQAAFQSIALQPSAEQVSPNFLEEVRALGQFPDHLDTSDAALPGRLAEAFARHPWVERVERVQLGSRGRIAVQLEYRQAVALVEISGSTQRQAITGKGIVLPAGADLERWRGLPVIEAAPPPAGKPGERWGHAAVESAARIAALLHGDRELFRVQAIRLREEGLARQLILRTEGGSEVVWEASTGGGDEVPDAEKLRRLRAYAREFGSLDRPAGPYRLDPRPSTGLLRAPLGMSP